MRAVNLIPAEQRTGARVGAGRSQGAAYAVLALILGLAGMIALYGKAAHQISSNQAQLASLTAEAQKAEAQVGDLTPYTSFLALRESRVQAVETLLESRFDWAHVFHEFGRVMPIGTSVSSLEGTVASAAGAASAKAAAGSSVASSTPPGAVPTFTLAGCALNQATVARLLERLRLIDGVSEVQLNSSTASSASGGGAGSSGGCPEHDPAYTVQLTFDPLPSATAVSAAVAQTKTVSDAGGASTSSATGKAGVNAR